MKFIIILLIGAGMWLLQYIFRDDEEEQRQQRRRHPANRPRPRPSSSRPRSQSSGGGSSDLDRFLEEARRRRQSKNQQEPVVEAELVRETPPQRPPKPKPRSRPKASQAQTPPPAPRPRPAEPVVEVREYTAEAEIPIQVVPENIDDIEMDVDLKSRAERQKGVTFTSMKEVEKILESNGFAPAVVLAEILKPPLSRRNGGYRS